MDQRLLPFVPLHLPALTGWHMIRPLLNDALPQQGNVLAVLNRFPTEID